jgi:hypothetical protein
LAQAYTPGLRVTENAVIVRERRLPLLGDVLVKVGDKTKARDVVARTFLPGDVTPINMASKLGCDPGDVPELMKKKEGDRIKRGEVLGQSKGIFGLFKSKITSPVDGTIEIISRITGQVQLRGEPEPVAIDAYIDGTVVSVHEKEGADIQATASFIQGIIGIGGEAFGEIKMCVGKPDEELTPDKVDASCKGKFIVGGCYVTCETLRKAAQAGVSGVVVGGIDAQDMKDFMGYDLGVAITGMEKLGLSLIITEGFGRIDMAATTFELLKKREGLTASMNGATQIRAGVMRPEVIIPLKDAAAVKASAVEKEVQGLTVGCLVRIIRSPNFGVICKIAAMPPELRKMESETMVRVLEVEFPAGRRALVPRANVEAIER